jgi:hypothetical protein
LKLEKLLCDFLDAMPCSRPILGSLLAENRLAIDPDARRVQHRMVNERRPLTTKAGRQHDDRPVMRLEEKVPDLIGGTETDGFGFPYGHDLHILHPRQPGHQFRNALGHSIGDLRIT